MPNKLLDALRERAVGHKIQKNNVNFIGNYNNNLYK